MTVPYFLRWINWRLHTGPFLLISQVLWILLSGWELFLMYIFGVFGLALTSALIFVPFAPALWRSAIFAFNPIYYQAPLNKTKGSILHYAFSPYVIVANIFWMFIFGWEFFLFHILSAILQAITILGLGNAKRHFEISLVALWPFGRSIIPRDLPSRPIRKVNEMSEV